MLSDVRNGVRLATLLLVFTAHTGWGTVASAQYVSPEGESAALQAAELLFTQDNWQSATAAFESYIEQYPKSSDLPRAYLRLGQAYARMDADAQARQAYTAAIQLDPEDTYAVQAVSYWGNLYVLRYRYREAAQMCMEVLRLYPETGSSEMAQYLLGTYLQADRRAEEAATAYQGFLDGYPESIYRRSVFQQLVTLLVQLDRAEEAEALVTDRRNEDPNDAQVLRQLATVYRKQNRHQEAIRLLRTGLAHTPTDRSLIEALGETYVEVGEDELARDVWMDLVASGDASYSAHQRLGTLLKRHGFYDDAAEQFEAAIRAQPSLGHLHKQLAEIHQIRGDVVAAVRVYANALVALGLSFSERRSVLSSMEELAQHDDYQALWESAVEAVQARVSTGGNERSGTLALAELHVIARRPAEAIRWFGELARLYADNGRLIEHYAQYLATGGDPDAAVALYQGALSLFPSAPETPRRLSAVGDLFATTQHWQRAADAYNEALESGPSPPLTDKVELAYVRVLLHGLRRPADAVERARGASSRTRTRRTREVLALLTAEGHLVLGSLDAAGSLLDHPAWIDAELTSEAAYLASEILLYRREYEAAATSYMRAARSNPVAEVANDALARLSLLRDNTGAHRGVLAAYVSAVAADRRGETPLARALCQEVIDSRTGAPVADNIRLLAAELDARTGDVDSAVRLCVEVAASDTSLAPSALLRLGELYRSQGDMSAAIEAYEQLLTRPGHTTLVAEARSHLRELTQNGTDAP